MSFINFCCHLPLQHSALILGCIDITLSSLAIVHILMRERRILKDVLVHPYQLILIDLAVCLLLATQILRPKLLLPWLVGQLITIVSTTVLYLGYYALGSEFWPAYLFLSSVIVLLGMCLWNYLFPLSVLEECSVQSYSTNTRSVSLKSNGTWLHDQSIN